jgi:outer membrane cobalamin receptor
MHSVQRLHRRWRRAGHGSRALWATALVLAAASARAQADAGRTTGAAPLSAPVAETSAGATNDSAPLPAPAIEISAGATAGVAPVADAVVDAGSVANSHEPVAPRAEPDEGGLEGLLSESVTSTASRSAESAADAPATTWSISGTDLKRFGIQSVEEAIRFLGHGMTSYEFDDRLNAAFGARGYNSDNIGLHLAVLIDGNQAGGSAKNARGTQQYMMPIELVDHIELVIGPGSVLYGNSAMLGVVNVVTRSASSLEGTHLVAQASAGLPADRWAKDVSWGEVWGRAAAYGGARFTLGGDPFELAWHFAARWDRQQGRSLWRPVEGADPYADALAAFTREDVFNRDLKGRVFARATWGHWTFLSSVAVSGSTGTGPINAGGASSSFEPEYMLDATWAKQVGEHGDLSLRAYGVVFDSSVKLVPSPTQVDPAYCLGAVGVPSCFDTLHYTNFRPFFEPVFTWDWNGDGAHVTLLGGQFFVDGSVITYGVTSTDLAQVKTDEPIVAPLPNGALFAQHVWKASFGTVNLGLRGDLGVIGSALSPRAAFSHELWKDGIAKVIFSTGFRTPTITERYLEVPHFLTTNENIKPEHVTAGEIDLSQRLGAQNLQLAIFITQWTGIITTRFVNVGGEQIEQFANIQTIGSTGVNLGWRGTSGPLDWALSANYAPGRVRLPADVAQYSDQQLADMRVQRAAIDRYGWKALGAVYLPSGGMPDFYATAHLSWLLGEGLPRLSVAANLNSPRFRVGAEGDAVMLDPRNLAGATLPWTVDVRGALEVPASERVGLRLVATWRSLANVANTPRVGEGNAPAPGGGVGASTNPVAPLSVMAEVSMRL